MSRDFERKKTLVTLESGAMCKILRLLLFTKLQLNVLSTEH